MPLDAETLARSMVIPALEAGFRPKSTRTWEFREQSCNAEAVRTWIQGWLLDTYAKFGDADLNEDLAGLAAFITGDSKLKSLARKLRTAIADHLSSSGVPAAGTGRLASPGGSGASAAAEFLNGEAGDPWPEAGPRHDEFMHEMTEAADR